MKWLFILGWFLQTTTMMAPFVMGMCIGVLILGTYPLLSFAIGTGIFWLFQRDSFEAWEKSKIISIFEVFRL